MTAEEKFTSYLTVEKFSFSAVQELRANSALLTTVNGVWSLVFRKAVSFLVLLFWSYSAVSLLDDTAFTGPETSARLAGFLFYLFLVYRWVVFAYTWSRYEEVYFEVEDFITKILDHQDHPHFPCAVTRVNTLCDALFKHHPLKERIHAHYRSN